MARSVNVFNKGLNQDYDPANISKYSMLDNINGRIMFNEEGTLDWVEDNGNKRSFEPVYNYGADTQQYKPIGYVSNGHIVVLFSVDVLNGYSEIGIVGFDGEGIGTYATLFNDQIDPNGDLNFSIENQIEARFIIENEDFYRVYWVDGVKKQAPKSNPPRAFTFSYDTSLPKNDVNAYSPVTTSVHAINSQAEFSQGIIKFVEHVTGQLKSGVYQYTYRLKTKDGYVSPWSILTRKLFLTSDEVSFSNWHDYEMEGSGIVTGKGFRLELKGIDTRFDEVEVGYVYCETNSEVLETNIFANVPANSTTIRVDHLSNSGEPIIADTIVQRFQGIRAAKTLNAKDNVLYYGNVIENSIDIDDLESIVQNVFLEPTFRQMVSDERKFTLSSPSPTLLTNQSPFVSETINRSFHSGHTEVYEVNNDYGNYKGTQVEHLFTGYWRGETYRFAIVFYDKLGYPYFALHIGDLTMPELYSDKYSFTRLRRNGTTTTINGTIPTGVAHATNNYGTENQADETIFDGYDNTLIDKSLVRVMGVKVSGIDISSIKDQISGFSIVRCDRDATIALQGVGFNSVMPDGSNITHPLPGHLVALDLPILIPPIITALYDGSGNVMRLRPNHLNVWYPDVMFDNSLQPTLQSNDVVKMVGSYYETERVSGYEQRATVTETTVSSPHNFYAIISKYYNTYNPSHNTYEPTRFYLEYGSEMSPVLDVVTSGIGNSVSAYTGTLDYQASFSFETDSALYGYGGLFHTNTFGNTMYFHGSWSKGGSNYSNFRNNEHTDTVHAIGVFNYVYSGKVPYGGLNYVSLEQSVFYSTGHFQPIGNPTFPESGTDIYDDIEVYGGDCYLDHFSFLRSYSRKDALSGRGTWAHGVSMPIESNFNLSMRQAQSSTEPIYPRVGARIPFSGLTVGLYHNSTSDTLREEFNYNDVLTFRELLQYFSPEPQNFKNISHYPARWRHTLVKFLGDTIDTWRQFEANAFEDLNLTYGSISSSSVLMNNIYSFQEKAFGRLRAFNRQALQSENDQSLLTGIGPALDGIDYINTQFGNQNQWGLVNTGNGIYWIDVFNRKFCKFNSAGFSLESDIRGLHNYFYIETSHFINADNPANDNGILGGYDAKNKEILITWNRNWYIENQDAFVTPITSIVNNDKWLIKQNDTLWIDNQTVGAQLVVNRTFDPLNPNIATIFYVHAITNDLIISENVSGVGLTSLGTITAGTYYKVFREQEGSAWQIQQVNRATVTPQRNTIVYNEYQNTFNQFHSFQPNFYISHNAELVSYDADESNDFFVHHRNLAKTTYYGQKYRSLVSVSINENSQMPKVYDTVKVGLNQTGNTYINNFIFVTERQNYFYDVGLDNRVRYQEDVMRMPIRTVNQFNRTRGRYLIMTMDFDNTTNIPVRIDNFMTLYRLSRRI